MDFDQQAHTHKHVEYSLKWANKFELHGNAIKKSPVIDFHVLTIQTVKVTHFTGYQKLKISQNSE